MEPYEDPRIIVGYSRVFLLLLFLWSSGLAGARGFVVGGQGRSHGQFEIRRRAARRGVSGGQLRGQKRMIERDVRLLAAGYRHSGHLPNG